MNNTKRRLFDRNDTYSLRGLCMICIILHHLYQYLSSRYGITFPVPLVIILSNIGYLATGVFFMISGFGLFASLEKNSPINWRYIARHLLNLYLPFLFVCIIQAIIDICQGGFDIKNGLASLLLMKDFWFMRTIFLLYISVFLLYKFVISTRIRIAILSSGVLTYILLSAFVFRIYPFWWNSILCFPVGMYCAFKSDSLQRLNTTRNRISILIVFIFTFCFTIFCNSSYCPRIIGEAIYPISMVLSSISFALFSIHFVSLVKVSNKVFNYFGTNSLSFYLYHIVFLKLCLFDNSYTYFISVWIGAIILVSIYRLIDKVWLSKLSSSLLSGGGKSA